MTTAIEYKTLTYSELAQWDDYVQAHPHSSPYHLSAWCRAVESAYSHEAVFCAAVTGDNLVGVLPMSKVSIPFKGKSYCSLPFCDVGAALADCDEVKHGLEQYALSLVEQHNGKQLQLRERDNSDFGADTDNLQDKKVSMLLPLPEDAETLLASFKSKLRSQVRKAEKNGLTYELGVSQQFIDGFYDVFANNMHRLGSPVHSKKWFEQIVSQYGNNCIISLVKKDRVVVGAGLVLFTNNSACIPWASTLVEYNPLSPNMLLYWSLLGFCADRPIDQFDFGRSTYQQGTYKFKSQWGAKPVLLNWRQLGREQTSEQTNQGSSSARTLVENAWKKMPLPVANRIGPLVRRYITL